ncbi:SufB/SufD family protein [Alicyclobacillus hesperidum]|uniref:SufB/SufD family protein n=1 Tax=Alicyclobacillus hesperidum TaxID=89784 RepID=UPI000308FDF2|nr:SufD family Fe-S cluster assembly protein [Alicyclobacillus hesperidum]
MSEVNTAVSHVHRVAQALGEPSSLLALREAAWRTFQELPQPYVEKTDLRKLTWETGTFSEQVGKVPAEVQAYIDRLQHSYALFVDGLPVDLRLTEEAKAAGVTYCTIHEAPEKAEALWKAHFGTVVTANENKWTALNQALFAGGVFLYAPKGTHIDAPFETVYVWTGGESGAYSRSLVVAAELADIQYAETVFAATTGAKVVNSHVLEIVALADSRVQVSTADAFHRGPTHFVTRRARVGKDAHVVWTVADTSDGLCVELVENELAGAGAKGLARVVGLGHGRAHVDLTASMRHVGRHTESEIVMHGALRDKANTIFRSRTEIVKGAVGAGSEQHDRMIMIDGTARADAIPMLLIDENDVQRCGHAASVGKIDPTQVYYLMSRGIPKSIAVQMIIWGYLHDTVEALASDPMRELVVARIERELSR